MRNSSHSNLGGKLPVSDRGAPGENALGGSTPQPPTNIWKLRLVGGYRRRSRRRGVRIPQLPPFSWRMGLLGEGRRPFKAEKRVRNPYALPNIGDDDGKGSTDTSTVSLQRAAVHLVDCLGVPHAVHRLRDCCCGVAVHPRWIDRARYAIMVSPHGADSPLIRAMVGIVTR